MAGEIYKTILWKFILLTCLHTRPKEATATLLSENKDLEFFNVNQRTASEPFALTAPLPWSCEKVSHWKILGDNHYPSRIFEVLCSSETCWYGHYNCTSILASVQVLRLCFSDRCSDHRVPASIRRNWQFLDIDINVGCQCMR